MRSTVLLPYPVISNGLGANSLTSLNTNIQYLDNVGVQCDVESGSTIAGTFSVQVSANHTETIGTGAPAEKVAGTWATIATQLITATAPLTTYFDLAGLSAPFIRVLWVPTTLLAQTVTTIADVASSLQSKYFLLCDGDGNLFYVWMNVGGAGVDPAIAGRTGIVVPFAANATANTIATAMAVAIDAEATFASSEVGAVVEIGNTTAGLCSALATDVNTGFAFAVLQGNSEIDIVVTGKKI